MAVPASHESFHDLPLAVLLIRDERGSYANPAAAELMKYPRDDLVGKSLLDLVGPSWRNPELYRKALGGKRVAGEFEISLVTADGIERPVAGTWARQGADLIVFLRNGARERRVRARLLELAELGARVQSERTSQGV